MILIGIPYHKEKEYCLEPLFKWIAEANLKDCEVIMRVHHGNFGEKDAVKTQREFFRQLAIQKDATHLMFVGADTIPPLDVVQQLLASNKDVVGGVYYGRNQKIIGENDTAVAWRDGETHFNTRANLESKTDLLEVTGMGMDCVLFTRKAFTAVSFMDWFVSDDDYPYYNRLKQIQISTNLNPLVVCKHYYAKDKYV